MKKRISLMLCAAMLAGCSNTIAEVTPDTHPVPETAPSQAAEFTVPTYASHFDSITEIALSDSGIAVNGAEETDAVFTSRDIIYYEDREFYDSGNPYGEGTESDRHSGEEAAAHTVVNITAPGAYRITGSLSAGQIRVDLGEDAFDDPNAVAELILSDADITCTVAPAILFLNTYECDNQWSADTARAEVDTSAAGANLILMGNNTVSGAYVARIFRDTDEGKKLWKQDGAIYSYMSMNVFGPGALDLEAANEGMDTELHLTINGGDIRIRSGNDGINTNEDGVSVTTINGGNVTILAGLGEEGDGVDSNGYLVINGGTVISAAKPHADAGLDSDLGSFIHGGTVIATGSTMDWAESDSRQVTLNLQFAAQQSAGTEIRVTTTDGREIFTFAPEEEMARDFSGLILSSPAFSQGQTYHIYANGVQLSYSGTDVGGFGPGGFGGRPGGMEPGQLPEDFDPSRMGDRERRPDRGDAAPPEGFEGAMPEGMVPPEMPQGGFGGRRQSSSQPGETRTEFYMHDMVNSFSGVAPL